MTENELATIAVDICYKIHTALGPGLLESVYEAAFVKRAGKKKHPIFETAGNSGFL
jgi:PD-(D/E)XK nuclease superfamily